MISLGYSRLLGDNLPKTEAYPRCREGRGVAEGRERALCQPGNGPMFPIAVGHGRIGYRKHTPLWLIPAVRTCRACCDKRTCSPTPTENISLPEQPLGRP